ncbi:DUF6211 family protein [Streptomyces sp. H10-C2]|uniref:DUF6211 family protein n=1 Tax=Streptomyces TaxID=1883 RepID=UPI0018DF424A|nr:MULTISPECIES: DUF6211 family protein [Streptomyces]MDJ0344258.1 DUF6211 family protein [Streptomyces sp. PH10-H1]MDJ0373596.1 DUF6211 family protein [Streptomyces sp. H10-C2]
MVNAFPPALESGSPLPFDTVTLCPGNSAGVEAGASFVVADLPPEAVADTYELNHTDDHPAYWDWAATVTIADIATVTRCTDAGPVTWTPVR